MSFRVSSLRRTSALLALTLFAAARPAAAQSNSDRDRDTSVTAAERSVTIAAALRALERDYFDPAVARRMADAVRAREARGEYARLTSASALADSLTAHLRAVSHDKHVGVDYSADVLPATLGAADTTAAGLAMRRRWAARTNNGVERVDRLAGNVGYLKLDGFADPEAGGATIAAAMTVLANTDAMLIDLRDNHGGRPTMVALLATYFFTGDPVHLNDIWVREGDRTVQSYTYAFVPGPRYLDRPVYVLTSRSTISAGEEFANDLKVLHRATIVGETTAGGANPGGAERLGDHFAIFVPRGRAINPVTRSNWEGTGVAPDVAAPADRALDVAQRLALQAILATRPDAASEREARAALARLPEPPATR